MMPAWRSQIAPQSAPMRYAMKLPKLTPPESGMVKSFFFPMFWSTSDAQSVAQSIQATLPKLAPGVHFADNFLTWGRNNSMFDDLEFVTAWQNNAETDADRAIVWRHAPAIIAPNSTVISSNVVHTKESA
jgi:hypothetical protein